MFGYEIGLVMKGVTFNILEYLATEGEKISFPSLFTETEHLKGKGDDIHFFEE